MPELDTYATVDAELGDKLGGTRDPGQPTARTRQFPVESVAVLAFEQDLELLDGGGDPETETLADWLQSFIVKDQQLSAAIAGEALSRGAADLGLQGLITTEATTRGNADTALQANINAEATTRGNADTAEAVARVAGDAAGTTAMATHLSGDLFASHAVAGGVQTNDTRLATWQAALDAAVTTQVNIVVIGDSIAALGWPWLLDQQLANFYSGQASIQTGATVGTLFADPTGSSFGRGWTTNTGAATEDGFGGWACILDPGEHARVTKTCDGVILAWRAGTGHLIVRDGGPAGSIIVDIDTSTGTGSTNLTYVDLTTYAAHDVDVACTVAAVTFAGGYFTVGNRTKGVVTWAATHAGKTTQNFIDNPELGLDLIDALDNPFVIVATGFNDSAALYPGRLGTLLDAVIARTNKPPIVSIPWGNAAVNGNGNAKAASGRTVANTKGCAIIDGYRTFGDVSLFSNVNSISFDGVHPLLNEGASMTLADLALATITGNDLGVALTALDRGNRLFTAGTASVQRNLVLPMRQDTAANWAAANPTLSTGEQGYDTTNRRWFIGDGATAYATLPSAPGRVDNLTVIQAGASSVGLAVKVTGDANNRWQVLNGGDNGWGGGTGAVDGTLKRIDVNTMRWSTGQTFQMDPTAGTGRHLFDQAFAMRYRQFLLTADSVPAMELRNDQISFGDGGATALDLVFARTGADVGEFGTGDRINVRGFLAVNSTAALGTVEKLRVNPPNTVSSVAEAMVTATGSGRIPLVLQGASGQTQPFLQLQIDSGTPYYHWTPTGYTAISTMTHTIGGLLSNLGGATTDAAIAHRLSADAAARWAVDIAGKHRWGDGTNAAEHSLERIDANIMRMIVGTTLELDVANSSGAQIRLRQNIVPVMDFRIASADANPIAQYLSNGLNYGPGAGSALDWIATRTGAGVFSITTGELRITTPGTNTASVPTLGSTNTLTAKRITSRVTAVTQAAVPTFNTDNMDVVSITGLAQAITSMTTNQTGTPVAGDMLIVEITDNGTNRAITWGAKFEDSTVAAPTTTATPAKLTTMFLWNAATSKWRTMWKA